MIKVHFFDDKQDMSKVKKNVSLINADSQITAKILSENIGISVRKIETNISKLRKTGIIRRIGPAKGGHWEITGKSIQDNET
ncbi:MAG: winged helix-turn-helix transcriptional regulator [Eubacteriales bacterium]|nr:winged helix-turn-helix transcriptional regulator [Eubacteriales bacterium]